MPSELTFDQVQEKMKAGAQLVEVLPDREYAEEHIQDAIHIPLKKLDAKCAESLDRDRPIIVYCWDYQCDLSPRAAWRLESLGFTEVYDYAGGKADWLANGLPTEGEKAGEARIGALARRDVLSCDLRDSVHRVRGLMESAGKEEAVVVHRDNVVMGIVRLENLGQTEETPVESVMEAGPSTFRPNVPLAEMLAYMEKRGMDTALVTTNDGILVGAFNRSDAHALQGDKAEAADPVNAGTS